MLVLSRKKNECIVIGGKIKVKVVDIRGDNVRLGVIADRHIPVHRLEVHNAINHPPLENASCSERDTATSP